MPCQESKYTPIYDNAFFNAIAKCPTTSASAYCECYDKAALDSLIRSQEKIVDDITARQTAIDKRIKTYPRQTEVQGPPLKVPSRADQKKNTFSKIFNPTNRKILVLVIAGFLLFLAIVSTD